MARSPAAAPQFDPESYAYDEAFIADTRASIAECCFLVSANIHQPGFDRISGGDIRFLFELYDSAFFQGALSRALASRRQPIIFKVSNRLTRSAGVLRTYDGRSSGVVSHEMTISAALLFQSFAEVEREIIVNGATCYSRMDALQRVFEHETIHLCEMLRWGATNCDSARFRLLAGRIFGHAGDMKHQLVTYREVVARLRGVRVGSWVTFSHDDKQIDGRVTGVRKRATVMVPTKDGRLDKYLVPVGLLKARGQTTE